MLLRCGIILIVLEQGKYLIPTHTSYLLRNAEFCAQILFKRFSTRERRKQVWQILCVHALFKLSFIVEKGIQKSSSCRLLGICFSLYLGIVI